MGEKRTVDLLTFDEWHSAYDGDDANEAEDLRVFSRIDKWLGENGFENVRFIPTIRHLKDEPVKVPAWAIKWDDVLVSATNTEAGPFVCVLAAGQEEDGCFQVAFPGETPTKLFRREELVWVRPRVE